MERDTFLEHYRLAKHYDGTPEQLSQVGDIRVYRALDQRSQQPVELKIIPLSSIDRTSRAEFETQVRAALLLDHVNIEKVHAFGLEDDCYVLVSEPLEGETVEDWIKQHGPMPPESVLRVAIQVVEALGAASFHKVKHRAIQPSNMAIVAGQAADGGWPFIKVINFALAGRNYGTAIDYSILPFASPEQLKRGVVDFRSEVYALGATMCFLLTAVALPFDSTVNQPAFARIRARQLRRFPRPLRRLIAQLLRNNPAERPQDPLLLTAQMRECLAKVERRQAFSHRFGLPLGAITPRSPDRKKLRVPVRGLAVAALLLALGVLAVLLLPEDVVTRLMHRGKPGKIVGVPVPEADASAVAIGQNHSVPPAARPKTGASVSPTQAALASTTSSSSSTTVAANPVHAPTEQPSVPPSVQPALSAAPEVAQSNSSASDPSAPQTSTASPANSSVALVAQASPPSSAQGSPAASTPLPAENPPPQIAANTAPPPAPPAEGPAGTPVPRAIFIEGPPALANANAESENARNDQEQHQDAATKTPNVAATASPSKTGSSARKTRHAAASSKPARVARSGPIEPRSNRGTMRAKVVGVTPGGNLILRLPSGEIAFVRPRGEPNYSRPRGEPDYSDEGPPPPRRRVIIPRRPEPEEPQPELQPFRLDPNED